MDDGDGNIGVNIEYCVGLFPKYAEVLNERRLRSDSTVRYSMFEGALSWTDEIIDEIDNSNRELRDLYLRLIRMRSLLMQGIESDRILEFFRKLKLISPNWAFFDEDRCSTKMNPLLNAFYDEVERDFDRAQAEMNLRRERNLSKGRQIE